MPSRFTKYSLCACAVLCLMAAPPVFSWMTSYFPCFKLELLKRPVLDDESDDILEYVGNVSTVDDVQRIPVRQDLPTDHAQIKSAKGQTEEKTANLKGQTEEKTANPKGQTEEKTANPKEQTEEKTANPKGQTEEKTANPKGQTEEKTANPKGQTEEKTANPKGQTEEKTANPKGQTEEKTANPKGQTEEKTANPKGQTEEKTANPKGQTEEKTANPKGQTEEKTANPKGQTEEKTANPKGQTEEKTANPKGQTEEKTANPKGQTEEKTANPKGQTEEKTANPKGQTEEKTANPKGQTEEKTANPKGQTEEKTANPKGQTEEKTANPKGQTEEKTGSAKGQTEEKTEEKVTAKPKSRAPPPPRKKTTKYIDRPILRKTLYPLTLNSPYILNNPKICRGLNPLHLLILVHTATAHFQQRQAIRSTWAGKTLLKTRTQRVVFLLGQTSDPATQHMLENELLTHGDLLQGPFVDSYHNLTHKGVMAYRWVYEHCSHAQLIFKVDDDVFVNPFLFYNTLYPRFRNRKRTIACEVQRPYASPVFRKKTERWRVEPFVFRGFTHYPPVHCRGYAVIITADIVRALYWAGYTTPFFWVDDVYLYGMLPAKVGNITHVDLRTSFTSKTDSTVRCYQRANCRTVATEVKAEAKFYKLWQLAKTQIPSAIKAEVNTTYLKT